MQQTPDLPLSISTHKHTLTIPATYSQNCHWGHTRLYGKVLRAAGWGGRKVTEERHGTDPHVVVFTVRWLPVSSQRSLVIV